MKNLLVAGLSLAAVSAGSAIAADLPARTAPPPYVTPPIFTWTGFYAGINAGYVFDGDTRFDRTTGQGANNVASLAAGLRPITARVRDDGFTAGGQVGYNYQFGVGSGVVVGIEADAAYTDLDRTRTFTNTTNLGPLVTPSAGLFTRNNQYRGELNFLGTVRGRVGYAFDNLLVYGTGGFAYGDARNSVVFVAPNSTTPFFTGTESRLKSGYAYGGGIEYALPTSTFLNVFSSSAVTIKAEYLHYQLGRDRIFVGSVNGGPGSYVTQARNEGDLFRVGLNYKFQLF